MHIAPLAAAAAAALLLAGEAAPDARPLPSPSPSPVSASATTDTTSAAAAQLFTALRGRWSCTGGFANGRPLAADLIFTPSMDGRTLRYRDADHAPSSYVQEATWAMSPTRHEIVSLAFAAGSKTTAPEPALFVATEWTPRSLTLVADTLQSPPWAPNRFTYTLPTRNTLKMVWEVNRAGAWQMGDSLMCRLAK